jgi:ribosomal protein L7Ae-like RNA K-turn-binding protein
MNKLLFALSLAKKSGKLVMGFDAVKTAVIHGTAHIVLLAEDLSEKTVKRVKE